MKLGTASTRRFHSGVIIAPQFAAVRCRLLAHLRPLRMCAIRSLWAANGHSADQALWLVTGEYVKAATFQSSLSRGMLGYGFSAIPQSGSRGLRDRRLGGGTAGGASYRGAAGSGRHGRHVDVRRHALLSGQAKKQRLSGLSPSRPVLPEECSSGPLLGLGYAGAPRDPDVAFGFRRRAHRRRQSPTSRPTPSKPGLTGA